MATELMIGARGTLLPARLAGRCANGYERDSGRVTHAVDYNGRSDGDYHMGAAVCGAKPGRRSAGWSSYRWASVTCPRCLRRLPVNGETSP